MADKMNLYQKLIEVRKEVPYLQKEAKGHQYNYNPSSQVLAAVRQKMDELGLLLMPSVTDKRVTIDGKNIFTEVDMEFTWVNADNPEETITRPWYAQGIDIAGEKGVGKAYTYAEKFFLLKFFNIATDKDDPDSFQERMDGNHEPKPNNVTHLNERTEKAGGITDAQRKALNAACKRNNIDGPTAMALLHTHTQKHNVDELTTAEASKLIKIFSEYKEAQ